jgi:polysaccharide export outer membrane protein
MRPSRLLALLLLAAALAGCAHASAPEAGLENEAPPAALDDIIYGRSGPAMAARPAAVAMPAPDTLALPVPVNAVRGPVNVPPPVNAMPDGMLPVLLPGTGEPYTLDSGDKLRIVVFGQEGLTNTYIVDAAGKITMPLIGAVPARGATTAQLARTIAERLRNGFIREPHVAIEVETYRPFFILGEVTYPGQYPYVPNMTVETAIAIAGGFSPRAYRYEVDLSQSAGGITARRKVPLIAPVRPGDTITVQERWF